jgi:hypothetical protein
MVIRTSGLVLCLTSKDAKKGFKFMWIDINGSKFNTETIAVVRPVDDDEDSCVIFTVGQSATDQGFLIDLPIDDVFAMIQQARLLELSQMMESETSEETAEEPEPEPEPEPE